jgi:hypothetical protein
MVECNLPLYAILQPAVVLSPGLFRALQKTGVREGLAVSYRSQDSVIHMQGPEWLGSDDLRILQGVAAFAGCQRVELPANPATDIGKRLREQLHAEHRAGSFSTLALTVSMTDLAKAIGYRDTGGRVRKIILAGLTRLSQVTLTVEGRVPGTYKGRLLAYIAAPEGGHISAALSPYLAGPIIGHTGQQFVHIDLAETRRLKSTAARLIHHRLCGWVDRGDCRKATLETLQGYLWPDATATGSTQRTRQQTTRTAIDEIARIGWGMKPYAVGKYEIMRPMTEGSRQKQKPRRSPTKRQANADRQSA